MIIETLDRVVVEILSAAGCDGPPVDVIALARRHLGMQIAMDRQQPQRGRAQRVGGKRQIYLRPEPREERHQWTVAHEVGEHLKPMFWERLEVEPQQLQPMAGESLANWFAPRLLLPTCWFAEDAAQCRYDLVALKGRYRTASHEVIALRFLDLQTPCIVTIVDNDHVHRRRSNAWPVERTMAPLERECQQYVNYYSRPRFFQQDGWSVQGWPVHQSDWKREILRSVIDEAPAG